MQNITHLCLCRTLIWVCLFHSIFLLKLFKGFLSRSLCTSLCFWWPLPMFAVRLSWLCIPARNPSWFFKGTRWCWGLCPLSYLRWFLHSTWIGTFCCHPFVLILSILRRRYFTFWILVKLSSFIWILQLHFDFWFLKVVCKDRDTSPLIPQACGIQGRLPPFLGKDHFPRRIAASWIIRQSSSWRL